MLLKPDSQKTGWLVGTPGRDGANCPGLSKKPVGKHRPAALSVRGAGAAFLGVPSCQSGAISAREVLGIHQT